MKADPPIVLVRWVDSMTLELGGWMDADEVPECLTVDAMVHESVGYLIADSADAIALAGSRNASDDAYHRNTRYSNVGTIPRRAIIGRPVKLARPKGAK